LRLVFFETFVDVPFESDSMARSQSQEADHNLQCAQIETEPESTAREPSQKVTARYSWSLDAF